MPKRLLDDVAGVRLLEALETVPRDEVPIATRSPFTGARVANLSPAVAQEVGYAGVPDGVMPASSEGCAARCSAPPGGM